MICHQPTVITSLLHLLFNSTLMFHGFFGKMKSIIRIILIVCVFLFLSDGINSAPTHAESQGIIITVDGLSFVNTYLGEINIPQLQEDGSDYIEAALESLCLPVDDEDIISFDWSRDAGDSMQAISSLRALLRQHYNSARSQGKKFIVVSHSWGTFLAYMALSYESTVADPIVCDLFITSGSPMGTYYAHDGLYPEEIAINGYVSTWLYALDFQSCTNCYPRTSVFVNYWAWGDLISGPLEDWAPLAENIKLDDHSSADGHSYRNIETTAVWHKYDSLQDGGAIDNWPFKLAVKGAIEQTLSSLSLNFVRPQEGYTISGTYEISISTTGRVDETFFTFWNDDQQMYQLIGTGDLNPDGTWTADFDTLSESLGMDGSEGLTLHATAFNSCGFEYHDEVQLWVNNDPAPGNIPPAISITSPSEPNELTEWDGFGIRWTASDPDNNAVIGLYYDIDNNYANGVSGIITGMYEDSGVSYYYWDTSEVPEGSYYILGRIDDGVNDEVRDYSDGTVFVYHPQQRDDFQLDETGNWAWDDDESGNDQEYINGNPEGFENLDLHIPIKNDSGQNLRFVRATLSSSNNSIVFANGDDFVNYGDINAGQIKFPDDDFEFYVNAVQLSNAPLNIHLTYEDYLGTNYVQDINFTYTFPERGTQTIELIAGPPQIDDTGTAGDGDGLFESGERLNFWVPIENTGDALCVNPRGIINQLYAWGSDVFSDIENNYPDIPAGATRQSENDYDTDRAPIDFAGTIQATMRVWYGPDRDKYKDVSFTLTVEPTPYMSLYPKTQDFGIVTPGTPVGVELEIRNPGSGVLLINNITASDGDILPESVSFPLSIPPGSSRSYSATIDTTSLIGFITRTITFHSNAYGEPEQSTIITGTVADEIPSATYGKLWQIDHDSPDLPFTNVVIGDTDNDGNMEIIASSNGCYSDDVPFPAKLYIYEQQADGSFSLIYLSGGLGGGVETHGLATGDFDNDGYTDIVVLASSNYVGSGPLPSKVHWFESTGNNSWTSRGTPISDSVDWLQSMTVGDSDNDGKQEIIVTRRGDDAPQVIVYEYNNGSFYNSWTSGNILDQGDDPTDDLLSVKIADSDSDGNNEIIFATDDAQIYIYERTGNNTYALRLEYQDQDYDYLGTYDIMDIVVADTDNDNKKEIIYTSDEGFLFILESTGNNTWNSSAPEHYQLPDGGEGFCLSVADVDNDGEVEIIVGGSDPGMYIYETIADNSHALSWKSSDTDVSDEVFSITAVDTDGDGYQEIVTALYEDWLQAMGYQVPVDLQIVSSNISITPDPLRETQTASIEAVVQNLSAESSSSVVVRFFSGDPDQGGSQIGTDQTITGIEGNGSETASVTWQPSMEGQYNIFVIVDPDNSIQETEDITNNKAFIDVDVLDNDQEGPDISDVAVVEYNGDGDGLIENNEQIKISWVALDDSGIGQISCVINGISQDATGSDYIISGPLVRGESAFTITVADGDNSPEISLYNGSFLVIAHAPEVVAVFPVAGDDAVSTQPIIEATFNVGLDAGSLSSETVTVFDNSSTSVSGDIGYEQDSNRVTFTPHTNLSNSVSYTISFAGGANGITDEHGNYLEQTYSWTFTVEPDTTDPSSIIVTPATNTYLNKTVTITGTAWDVNFDRFELHYGSGQTPGAWTLINTQFDSPVMNDVLGIWDTTLLTDGSYTLRLRVTDKAPANNTTAYTVLVNVDNTAPAPPVVIGLSEFNNPRPRWMWSTGGGGTGLYRYKLDAPDVANGGVTTRATTFTPDEGLSEGAHLLYVQEIDGAGNWSVAGSFSLIVDLVLPGDINDDSKIDLKDAIILLKVLSGDVDIAESIRIEADIDGNGSLGMSEILNALQHSAGLREE